MRASGEAHTNAPTRSWRAAMRVRKAAHALREVQGPCWFKLTCASFLRIRNATRNMLNMSLSRLLMRVACDAVTPLDHVKLQCHASQSYARLRHDCGRAKKCGHGRTFGPPVYI